MKKSIFILLLYFVTLEVGCNSPLRKYKAWAVTYGGNAHLNYSALTQIDTSNVDKLQIAWVYHSEDSGTKIETVLEVNPIVIGDTLFGVSPTLKLFAINAATGKEIWKFRPFDSLQNNRWWKYRARNVIRGVNYWTDGQGEERIIFVAGSIVYAVNATTGKLIGSFGVDGGINLERGLGRDPDKMYVAVTSPVLIYKNMFYVGGLISDNTPGFIRAFDVKTGKQKWIFHTIPYPGYKGYDSWEDTTAYKWAGSTNSWGGFSLDEKRGILYAPTGTPTNDFYGGKRWGDNLFGSCLLALDAKTGELLWYFQNVHHDVWDMDVPSAPALVTINHNGEEMNVAVLTTKTGYVYVFNRETGEPIFPIKTRKVPTDLAVPGERLSPIQPYSPISFTRQKLTVNDLNPNVSDSEYQELVKRFKNYNYKGMFTPPTEKGSIIFPGYDGGGDWGGPTVDPTTDILYINSNQMAWVSKLIPKERPQSVKIKTNLDAGKILYQMNCMQCHGADRSGGGEGSEYPSLINVAEKYSLKQFKSLLKTGRGMMPGFPQLSKEKKKAIASFILDVKPIKKEKYTGEFLDSDYSSSLGSVYDYSSNGYKKFLTEDGMPAISPPWGLLTAIDLNTGKKVWQIPLGEDEKLKKKGIKNTGCENYGGSVVTAGGLLFIGATRDGKFRAFNKWTGELLFETELPASASATPAVYSIDGKEYVVIACGGSKWGGKKSDTYVAFTLPDPTVNSKN